MQKSTVETCRCERLASRLSTLIAKLADETLDPQRRNKLQLSVGKIRAQMRRIGCAQVSTVVAEGSTGAEIKAIAAKLFRRKSTKPYGEDAVRAKRKQQKTVRGRGRQLDFGIMVQLAEPTDPTKVARIQQHQTRRRESNELKRLDERYCDWKSGVPHSVTKVIPVAVAAHSQASDATEDDFALDKFDLGWGG